MKLTARYLPRGGFDHAVPEHGGPGTSKAGGFKCADCHRARTSDKSDDVLIPDLAKCGTCHGRTTAQIAAADDADCTTCHSFHKPGQATPKPGQPPLQTLRWTEAMTRRAPGPDPPHLPAKRRKWTQEDAAPVSRSGVRASPTVSVDQTTPNASMASATFLKPAMLAPRT